MVTLIIGFPQSSDANRIREYDECLRRNVANRGIDSIIVLKEEDGSRKFSAWSENPKISSVDVDRRATYMDFLTVANRLRDVVVIANADVYFDWSASKLNHIYGHSIYAITRTDMFRNLWSSDAWAFRPPLPVKGCEWSLGRMECETAFQEQVKIQLGWQIYNPCYEVCLTHLHGSNVFSKEHDRNVGYVNPPCPLVVLFDRLKKKFYWSRESRVILSIEMAGGLKIPCKSTVKEGKE